MNPLPEIPPSPEQPEFIPDAPNFPYFPDLPEITPEHEPDPVRPPVELPSIAGL
ncbi:hypothetical protein [Dyadobacter luticola]|uniref:hypothetical protein n=1 Tax=Dyadobacter luticola TaxID=1979387 RepID=UPI0014868F2C|nr:hypothetical protein [Dyadobacter luticola]